MILVAVTGLRVIADLDWYFPTVPLALETASSWRRTATGGYGAGGTDFRRDCIAIADAIELAAIGRRTVTTRAAIDAARLPARNLRPESRYHPPLTGDEPAYALVPQHIRDFLRANHQRWWDEQDY